MKNLLKKLESLETKDLLSLQKFIKELLPRKALENVDKLSFKKAIRKKTPLLCSVEWESIRSACITCKYFPLIQLLSDVRNKPTEMAVFDKILTDLGYNDVGSSFKAFQFLAVPCINSTLKNKEVNFRLRRVDLTSTKFCFFRI